MDSVQPCRRFCVVAVVLCQCSVNAVNSEGIQDEGGAFLKILLAMLYSDGTEFVGWTPRFVSIDQMLCGFHIALIYTSIVFQTFFNEFSLSFVPAYLLPMSVGRRQCRLTAGRRRSA